MVARRLALEMACRLDSAIRDSNAVENLRALLQARNQSRRIRRIVLDDDDDYDDDSDINAALSVLMARRSSDMDAALGARISDMARLLYDSLTPASKQLHTEPTSTTTERTTTITDDPFIPPPLHGAASWGHATIVRWLVEEKGVNVNQKNNVSGTPLYSAITAEQHASSVEIAQILIQNGADKNEVDTNGTPIILAKAIGLNNIAIVRLLLENGATASEADVGNAFRSVACTELVALLLQYKAAPMHDFATVREAVSTLVYSADIAKASRIATYRVLKPYAKTNIAVFMALQAVLRETSYEVTGSLNFETGFQIHDLVDAGVAPALPEERYELQLAIQAKDAPACEALLQEHPGILNPFRTGSSDDDDDSYDYSLSPLNIAGSKHGGDNMAIFNHFLRLWNPNNRSTRSRNNGRDLPIHLLSRQEDVSVEAIKAVMEQHPGAVAVQNSDGFYPFHLAATSGADPDVIYTLLRAYPDALRLQPNLRPPAHSAIVAPPEAAVIDVQARNQGLQAQNASLREEESLKDAEIVRIWQEASLKDEAIYRLNKASLVNDAEIVRLRAETLQAEIAALRAAEAQASLDDAEIDRIRNEADRLQRLQDAQIPLQAEIAALRAADASLDDAEIDRIRNEADRLQRLQEAQIARRHAPPAAAVMDMQAHNEALQAQNAVLRAEAPFKDAAVYRTWQEASLKDEAIDRLREQALLRVAEIVRLRADRDGQAAQDANADVRNCMWWFYRNFCLYWRRLFGREQHQ